MAVSIPVGTHSSPAPAVVAAIAFSRSADFFILLVGAATALMLSITMLPKYTSVFFLPTYFPLGTYALSSGTSNCLSITGCFKASISCAIISLIPFKTSSLLNSSDLTASSISAAFFFISSIFSLIINPFL